MVTTEMGDLISWCAFLNFKKKKKIKDNLCFIYVIVLLIPVLQLLNVLTWRAIIKAELKLLWSLLAGLTTLKILWILIVCMIIVLDLSLLNMC